MRSPESCPEGASALAKGWARSALPWIAGGSSTLPRSGSGNRNVKAIIAAMAAAMATFATAGPQTYSTSTQQIRAGVVIITSSNASAAPHALFNFDANINVKPAGWSLVNPYAPSRVTNAIANRWTAASVGNRISKREAAYWEVFLSQTSDVQLANYDFLLLDPVGYTSLLPIERERLRRFVDHGGVLWIDPAGIQSSGNLDAGNNFPAPFEILTGGAGAQLSDFTNPLLSRPTTLSTQDVNVLNSSFSYDLTPPNSFLTALPGYYGNVTGDYQRIQPVTLVNDGANGAGGSTTLGVMQIGAGYVVITSRGASLLLNRVAASGNNYLANSAYEGLSPSLQVDGLAAAKLVTNMISLTSQFRMQSGDSRHTNSIAIDLGGPLLTRMADPAIQFGATTGTTGNTVPVNYGAVCFKGITIVSSYDHLAAFQVDPNAAVTGNGDPSELTPTTPGSGADLLWISPTLPAPISAPVLAEVPNSSVAPEQVLVTDANGTVHSYNPVARNANGTLNTSVRQPLWSQGGSNGDGIVPPPAGGAAVTGGTPNPPTVHEGLAYQADTVFANGANHGRIWVINMATGQRMNSNGNDWFLGGEGSPFQAPPFVESATIGYIQILDNSGGMDRVLYVPWSSDITNGAAGFVSLWIGSRGEQPVSAEVTGNTLSVTTRASQQGGLPIYAPTGADPLGIHLVVLDSNGNPVPATTMAALFTGSPVDAGGGIINFTLGTAGAAFFGSGTPNVRIDYTIDWDNNTLANNGVLSSVERGRIQLPDQLSPPTRSLTGPLALSPAGTIYMAASGNGTAGLFGFQEQGRGNFVCVNRFELYPKYQFSTQGAGLDTEQPVVGDNDTIATVMAPAFLYQQFSRFSIVGAPTIRNGEVIISVTAYKLGIVPCTILMALQSEPAQAQFAVPSLPDGSVLVQADLVRSTEVNQGTAEVPAILTTAGYSYNSTTGLLTINNLMNTTRGAIQQCLSLSQPVYLRAPGASDVLIVPDNQAGASSWSPLLWYTVLNGFQPQTGPLITGNSVYIGGGSAVLSILNGAPGNGQPMVQQGLLYAFKANISPNDPTFVKTIDIPPGVGASVMSSTNTAYQRWNKQIMQLTVDTSGNFDGNPDVEWPQANGANTFQNYISRLSQTVLAGSTQVEGIAAGDGALVAQGNNGLYTFDRADFVVADSGRITTFDPSGNPLWSTDSYFDTGAASTGGAASVHQLVRPTRAYRLNSTDFLVVDSGANTVVRLNMAGLEIRAINNILIDPNAPPNGYTAGEPSSLNDPRDATTFATVSSVSSTGSADLNTGISGPSLSVGDGESASGPNYEIWTHYLIADTGNHRLIEVVDRYAYNPANGATGGVITVQGVPQLGVVVWHSPAVVNGKKYDYNSITRSLVPTGTGTTKYVYIAAIGSVMPSPADLGIGQTGPTSQREAAGNGGIIVFDPAQPGPLVFNQLYIPPIPANALWVENPITGVGSFSSAAQPAATIPMSHVSSVSSFVTTVDGTPTGAPAIDIMISCGSGVYETLYNPLATGASSPVLGVTWMVPNQVFRVIRQTNGVPTGSNPLAVQASYAERLSPTDVVIVNGYFGTTRAGGTYQGEVLQLASGAFNINSTNFGFSTGSITFQLPPIQGARSLVLPVFADRR